MKTTMPLLRISEENNIWTEAGDRVANVIGSSELERVKRAAYIVEACNGYTALKQQAEALAKALERAREVLAQARDYHFTRNLGEKSNELLKKLVHVGADCGETLTHFRASQAKEQSK